MKNVEGIPERAISLTGCLFGIYAEVEGAVMPVTFELEGETLLPVFSTPEKLRAAFIAAGIEGGDYAIKQIMDGKTFLDSAIEHFPVILDPWKTDRGTTRFTMVQRMD